MSDQDWNVLEFVERFRNGEFDGQLGETLNSLSPRQIEDLQGLLLMQGESRNGIVLADPDKKPHALTTCHSIDNAKCEMCHTLSLSVLSIQGELQGVFEQREDGFASILDEHRSAERLHQLSSALADAELRLEDHFAKEHKLSKG